MHFKQVEVVPSNALRQVCKFKNYRDDHSQFCECQVILPDNKLEIFVQEFEKDPGPLIQFSYSQIVNISLGLRAPPTV